MDAPARAVSGLTPAAKALFVAAAAHAQPRRRRPLRRAERRRPRADLRRRRRSSWPRSKGCRRRPPSARSCRSRRTKSIRTAAWRRTSASPRRAPGRSTPSPRALRASSSRRRRRCCRGSRTPERLLAASLDAEAGPGHLAADLAELLVDAGFTREDPADEHGEFALRGGIARRLSRRRGRIRCGSSSSATPSRRCAPTIRRRSDRSRRSISWRSCRCATCSRTIAARTIFDYLARASASRIDRLGSATRSTRTSTKLLEQLQHSYERQRRPTRVDDSRRDRRCPRADVEADGRRRVLPTRRDCSSTGTRSPRASRRRPQLLDPRRRRRRPSRARPLPAGGRAATAASPTGSPRSASCATTATRRCSSPPRPGRAERTIELLKEYDVFAVPVERADDARYAAVLVAIGALVARLPAARRRPADLRRGRCLRRRAARAGAARARRPRRSSPTCAISRSAISSSTSTTASASSSA